MAQEKPNRIVEWYLLLRRQTPVVRRHLVDWGNAVREEPDVLWRTPITRYAAYLIVGLMLAYGAGWVARGLAPPPPVGAQAEATTADFHVRCTNPNCGNHFAVRRSFGFDDFPVRCPACGEMTGYAARLCASSTCRGRWVVPVRVEGSLRCAECSATFR